MRFDTSSNGEEGSWLLLDLHSECQSKWFSCPLESTFGGQRVVLDVWY